MPPKKLTAEGCLNSVMSYFFTPRTGVNVKCEPQRLERKRKLLEDLDLTEEECRRFFQSKVLCTRSSTATTGAVFKCKLCSNFWSVDNLNDRGRFRMKEHFANSCRQLQKDACVVWKSEGMLDGDADDEEAEALQEFEEEGCFTPNLVADATNDGKVPTEAGAKQKGKKGGKVKKLKKKGLLNGVKKKKKSTRGEAAGPVPPLEELLLPKKRPRPPSDVLPPPAVRQKQRERVEFRIDQACFPQFYSTAVQIQDSYSIQFKLHVRDEPALDTSLMGSRSATIRQLVIQTASEMWTHPRAKRGLVEGEASLPFDKLHTEASQLAVRLRCYVEDSKKHLASMSGPRDTSIVVGRHAEDRDISLPLQVDLLFHCQEPIRRAAAHQVLLDATTFHETKMAETKIECSAGRRQQRQQQQMGRTSPPADLPVPEVLPAFAALHLLQLTLQRCLTLTQYFTSPFGVDPKKVGVTHLVFSEMLAQRLDPNFCCPWVGREVLDAASLVMAELVELHVSKCSMLLGHLNQNYGTNPTIQHWLDVAGNRLGNCVGQYTTQMQTWLRFLGDWTEEQRVSQSKRHLKMKKILKRTPTGRDLMFPLRSHKDLLLKLSMEEDQKRYDRAEVLEKKREAKVETKAARKKEKLTQWKKKSVHLTSSELRKRKTKHLLRRGKRQQLLLVKETASVVKQERREKKRDAFFKPLSFRQKLRAQSQSLLFKIIAEEIMREGMLIECYTSADAQRIVTSMGNPTKLLELLAKAMMHVGRHESNEAEALLTSILTGYLRAATSGDPLRSCQIHFSQPEQKRKKSWLTRWLDPQLKAVIPVVLRTQPYAPVGIRQPSPVLLEAVRKVWQARHDGEESIGEDGVLETQSQWLHLVSKRWGRAIFEFCRVQAELQRDAVLKHAEQIVSKVQYGKIDAEIRAQQEKRQNPVVVHLQRSIKRLGSTSEMAAAVLNTLLLNTPAVKNPDAHLLSPAALQSSLFTDNVSLWTWQQLSVTIVVSHVMFGTPGNCAVGILSPPVNSPGGDHGVCGRTSRAAFGATPKFKVGTIVCLRLSGIQPPPNSGNQQQQVGRVTFGVVVANGLTNDAVALAVGLWNTQGSFLSKEFVPGIPVTKSDPIPVAVAPVSSIEIECDHRLALSLHPSSGTGSLEALIVPRPTVWKPALPEGLQFLIEKVLMIPSQTYLSAIEDAETWWHHGDTKGGQGRRSKPELFQVALRSTRSKIPIADMIDPASRLGGSAHHRGFLGRERAEVTTVRFQCPSGEESDHALRAYLPMIVPRIKRISAKYAPRDFRLRHERPEPSALAILEQAKDQMSPVELSEEELAKHNEKMQEEAKAVDDAKSPATHPLLPHGTPCICMIIVAHPARCGAIIEVLSNPSTETPLSPGQCVLLSEDVTVGCTSGSMLFGNNPVPNDGEKLSRFSISRLLEARRHKAMMQDVHRTEHLRVAPLPLPKVKFATVGQQFSELGIAAHVAEQDSDRKVQTKKDVLAILSQATVIVVPWAAVDPSSALPAVGELWPILGEYAAAVGHEGFHQTETQREKMKQRSAREPNPALGAMLAEIQEGNELTGPERVDMSKFSVADRLRVLRSVHHDEEEEEDEGKNDGVVGTTSFFPKRSGGGRKATKGSKGACTRFGVHWIVDESTPFNADEIVMEVGPGQGSAAVRGAPAVVNPKRNRNKDGGAPPDAPPPPTFFPTTLAPLLPSLNAVIRQSRIREATSAVGGRKSTSATVSSLVIRFGQEKQELK